jgi:ribosomal-protein-alanine N-acetyltransferase
MTEPVAIVRGDVDRLKDIMPIMAAAFPPEFGEAWSEAQCRGMLGLPGTALVIAESRETVLGFALARTVLEEAELLLLAVHPDRHCHGFGALLLADIQSLCRNLGAKQLHVEVRHNNPALQFYAKCGFDAVGSRPNYYRGKSGVVLDAVTLQISLN